MSEPADKPTAKVVPPAAPCHHWVIVAIIFAAGIGIGIGVGRMMWYKPPRSGPRTMAQRRERMMKKINADIDLTDEQAEMVGRIVEQRVEALWALRNQFMPKAQEQFDRMEKDVAAILDPDQQADWKDFCDAFRLRRFTPPEDAPASQPAADP